MNWSSEVYLRMKRNADMEMPKQIHRNLSDHIKLDKEMRDFQALMKERMPEWRETQIQRAHKEYLASKSKPSTVTKVKHPVLLGDRK